MDMLASRLLQHGAMAKSFKLSTLQHRLPSPLHNRIPKPGRRSVFQVLCSGPDAKAIIVGGTAGGRHANLSCDDGASSFDFERYMSAHEHAVKNELDTALTSLRCPESLRDAMRYSVLSSGGNLVCSMLAVACCELVGATASVALPVACAMEMISAAAFIHDDMPCMDNAALRRGVPSCHVAFGESVALQAGNALAALALEHVARAGGIPANLALRVVAELANMTGAGGVAAGQVADKENEGTADHAINLSTVEYVAMYKAVRLMEGPAVSGATVGGGSDDEVERLRRYARTIGLLAQVVNDLLDVTGTMELTGKATGEDAAAGKCTYVSVMGIEGARAYAGELVARAEVELEGFDAERAAPLLQLPRFMAYPVYRARVIDRSQQPIAMRGGGIW